MGYEFIKFAQKYDDELSKVVYKRNERMSAFNPIIFLFIGNKVKDSMNYISDTINNKWENGNGFIYLYISEDELEEKDNLLSFKLNNVDASKELLRAKTYECFLKDKIQLERLNNKIIDIKKVILEKSREFSFCERVSISVITRVDDPLNSLVVPITALFKSKLGEYFKIVNADLFDIIDENTKSDDIGYDASVSMSFFNEIELCQNHDSYYSEILGVQNSDVQYPVEFEGGTLFDLIFILGDRDELGFYVSRSEESNCRVISYVSLIKNRDRNGEIYSSLDSTFDETAFKNAIYFDKSRQSYVSAGLSEIKRANKPIALVVLHTFYKDMLSKLKGLSNIDNETVLVVLGIDERTIVKKVADKLSRNRNFEDMNSIMYAMDDPRKIKLKGLSYRMVEEQMYKDGCLKYFKDNYSSKKKVFLDYEVNGTKLEELVYSKIIDNVQYGLYTALHITSEDGLIKELNTISHNLSENLTELEMRQNGFYNDSVKVTFLDRIFKKRAVKKVKNMLFNKIYALKFDRLVKQIELDLISVYKDKLRELHEIIKNKALELESLDEVMNQVIEEEISKNTGYACENIVQYYQSVIGGIEKEFSEKHGSNFFFDTSFFGNVSELLKRGMEEIENRLILISSNIILNRPEFNKPFEKEMQERSYFSTHSNGLADGRRDELFRKINERLESEAKVHVHLIDYGNDYKKEEKYFFGKGDSAFIKYAYNYDSNIRNYKLGRIDTNLKTGIEKLNILGGFNINNLFVYRQFEKNYKYYVEEKGFVPTSINFTSKKEG